MINILCSVVDNKTNYATEADPKKQNKKYKHHVQASYFQSIDNRLLMLHAKSNRN